MGLSGNCQNLVNSFAGSYGGGTPITHTFAVSSGAQYKVQFIVARGNPLTQTFALSGASTDSYTFNGYACNGTYYTLIADTFTATSNSLTVTVTANGTSAINGFTLEALTAPPPPPPSGFVMTQPSAESALDFTGTFVAAYNYGGGASAFTLGNAAFTVPSLPSGWNNESANNAWGMSLSGNCQNLVNSFAGNYGGGTPITHTFSVTSGAQYKVQFIVARGNPLNQTFALSGACADSYTFNGYACNGTYYTLITDSFTATSNSLTVTVTANGTSALNGFTLENVSP